MISVHSLINRLKKRAPFFAVFANHPETVIFAELSPKLMRGPLLRGQPVDRKFHLAFRVSANMCDFYYFTVSIARLRLAYGGG
jgi:hypothetical protein